MAVAGRRQVQAFDLDAFEDDGGDIDSPGLMHLFVKQNKRVLKIFESPEKSANEESNGNQSYGLRLISRSDDLVERDSRSDQSASEHNGDDAVDLVQPTPASQKQQVSQLNVRNLSPIDIITLSSEDVSEQPSSQQRTSQRVPVTSRFKPSQSMRRSLFRSENFPPSSTPLAPNRKTNENFYKDAFDSILSPIKQTQPKKVPVTPKAVQLRSLEQIEQDLEQQFGIKEVGSSQTTPATQLDPCVVQLERMQVDEDAMPAYLRRQESEVAHVPNHTNFAVESMVETPVAQRNVREKPECNEELAQKLRLCETSSDGSIEASPGGSENIVIATAAEASEEPDQNEVSSTSPVRRLPEQLETLKSMKKGRKSNKSAAQDAKCLPEDATLSEISRNDSISKTLDPEVMKSFRNLSKRPAVQDQLQPKDSFKFAQPKGKRASTGTVTSSTAEYLDMTKEKKKKKPAANSATINRKRTLYSQEEDNESEEISTSPQQSAAVDSESSPQPIEKATQSDGSHSSQQQSKRKKKSPKKKARQQSTPEESSASDGENVDEGFASEDLTKSIDDVRYDPYERGCQRPGLRVRRYATPYWINNGTAKNYAITYGTMTKKQCKEEEKLLRSRRKGTTGSRNVELPKPGLGLAMVLNAFAGLRESRQKKAARKPVHHEKAQNGSKNSENDTSTDDQSTAKTVYSISAVIEAAMSSNQTEAPIMRNSYNMASITSVQFRDCGEGLYFGAFIEGQADGIIKLIPGGRKKLARSKYSSLKFFVLQGSVEVTCNNESLKLDTFGFMYVKANYYYALNNTSDHDVFVHFTRFDRRRE